MTGTPIRLRLMDAQISDPSDPTEPDEDADTGGLTGLVADVRQLAADARALAEAELAYQASRARVAGAAARNMALFGLAAFVLAFFALGALTVGLLLALTPMVTAWGAMAIVVGVLMLAALSCVMAVMGTLKRLRAAISDRRSEQ